MEESLARNLFVLVQLLWKVGMMTGLLPAAVMVVCCELFYIRKTGKLIPFPRKPLGPWPGKRTEKEWRKAA
jgi:hypothetical protein